MVPSVGLTVNPTPLQLTVVIALMTAVGLIVTVTVNAAPVQLPDNGVTEYVAICAIFVGFVKLPLMSMAFVALIPPVRPPVTVGTLQLYNVPCGTIPSARFVGLTVNPTPLQVTVVRLLITAVGLIVIVNVNVDPVHTPDNGVTVYVAVCVVFNGFVNVPLIFGCILPIAPPVNPPLTLGTLQLYTIPAGTIPFVPFIGLIVNATPLQLTELIAVITGVGLIVTVTVNAAPVQLPDTGVTT